MLAAHNCSESLYCKIAFTFPLVYNDAGLLLFFRSLRIHSKCDTCDVKQPYCYEQTVTQYKSVDLKSYVLIFELRYFRGVDTFLVCSILMHSSAFIETSLLNSFTKRTFFILLLDLRNSVIIFTVRIKQVSFTISPVIHILW